MTSKTKIDGIRTSTVEFSERLVEAIEAAGVGTFHIPIPLSQIYWNETCAEHFWGERDAKIDLELFYRKLHPDDRERTKAAVEAAVFKGTACDIEYRVLSPLGEIRWLRAKGRARVDEQGRVIRLDGIMLDISSQKELEHKRCLLLEHEKARRLEAERLNNTKDFFIAKVSHELRTPLNSMQAWAELLESRPSEVTFVEQCVKVIRRIISLQSRLVNDLLDTSRIAADKLEIIKERLLPLEAVDAELQALGPLAMRKNVSFSLDFKQTTPVLADRQRLRQVFANLLSNALKHTPSGGRISVSVWQEEHQVKICIADTGDGIPAPFLERIFDAFEQVDGTTTRKHGGLGLGLAISRKLIALHGGTLAASSDGLNLGATFTVTLPTATTSADFENTLVIINDNLPLYHYVSTAEHTVLFVDDDPDSLEAFSLILREANYEVFVASSAEIAREILLQNKIDVIISDISMPGEDGYNFISSIRRNGVNVPALAVTAFARHEDRLRARAAGFNEHLAKPVQPALLLQSLAKLIGRQIEGQLEAWKGNQSIRQPNHS